MLSIQIMHAIAHVQCILYNVHTSNIKFYVPSKKRHDKEILTRTRTIDRITKLVDPRFNKTRAPVKSRV